MRRSTNKNSEKKTCRNYNNKKWETKWQDKTNKLVFENIKRTLICIRISLNFFLHFGQIAKARECKNMSFILNSDILDLGFRYTWTKVWTSILVYEIPEVELWLLILASEIL